MIQGLYHFTVKVVSRSTGRSAPAAGAYRSGTRMIDARTGLEHDYSGRDDIACNELLLPPGAPAWGAEQTWNECEHADKRRDACTAREIEVGIPASLSRKDQVELALELGQLLVDRYRVAAQVNVHIPHGQSDKRNVHAHILLSSRRLGPNGFGEKTMEFDPFCGGGRQTVRTLRKDWADLCNRALQRNQLELFVDHRSYKEQGIDREPTLHMGYRATTLERMGLDTQIGEKNRAIGARNRLRKDLNDLIRDIEARIAGIVPALTAGLDVDAVLARVNTIAKDIAKPFQLATERISGELRDVMHVRGGEQFVLVDTGEALVGARVPHSRILEGRAGEEVYLHPKGATWEILVDRLEQLRDALQAAGHEFTEKVRSGIDALRHAFEMPKRAHEKDALFQRFHVERDRDRRGRARSEQKQRSSERSRRDELARRVDAAAGVAPAADISTASRRARSKLERAFSRERDEMRRSLPPRLTWSRFIESVAQKGDDVAVDVLAKMRAHERAGNLGLNRIVIGRDTPPIVRAIPGFEAALHRDGSVAYRSGGVVAFRDVGESIAIDDHSAAAVRGAAALAGMKTREVTLRGSAEFRDVALGALVGARVHVRNRELAQRERALQHEFTKLLSRPRSVAEREIG